jgi:hypothetical protein
MGPSRTRRLGVVFIALLVIVLRPAAPISEPPSAVAPHSHGAEPRILASEPQGSGAQGTSWGKRASSVQSLNVTLSVNPAVTDLGRPVNFTATPTGGVSPYKFYWLYPMIQFGCLATNSHPLTIWTCPSVVTTSNSSSTISPDVEYGGNESVSVGVNDSAGSSIIVTQGFVLNPPPRITALEELPISPRLGENLTFSGSVEGGTTPYNSTWSFGDGGKADSLMAVHDYSRLGTFTAVLTIRDAEGVTTNASLFVSIVPKNSSANSPGAVTNIEYAALGVVIGAAAVAAVAVLWKRRRKAPPRAPGV